MSIDTRIALPRSLHDYIDCREDVIRLLTHAHETLDTAASAMRRFYPYGLSMQDKPHNSLAESIKEVDRKMWRQAFDKTGLHTFMDADARRQFEDALERRPVPFTLENVRTELLSFRQNADEMYARGVYNVFRQLPAGYRTNTREPFELGRKAIMTLFSPRWSSGIELSRYRLDLVNDIDRVFKTLDNAPYVPRSLESAINAAMAEQPYIFEDDYYRIKGYKNGNAHIEFKRSDLLERVNQIIGEYCNGNALANGKAA